MIDAEPTRHRGFTLVELAMVVLIVALLLGGMLGMYSRQVELSKISDTKRTLETVRDALVGFAAANGRLPCPATSASNGLEAPAGGTCTVSTVSMPGVGFVPASTLALTPVDNQGFLLDAWGSRVRYAVTISSPISSEFTTQGQIRAKLTDLDPNTPAPDLQVCSTATGVTGAGTGSAACASASTLTTNAVAVIFSVGKNGVLGGTGGAGTDESKNLDGDRVFISHESASSSAPNGEFDDILIWLSPPILYNRILSGGL
jgi:prepilin-type N-terminal cleavage/methylation domain-containing protein